MFVCSQVIVQETAKCLLHSFPSNIEHCLQWARELLFEGEFVVNPEEGMDAVRFVLLLLVVLKAICVQ